MITRSSSAAVDAPRRCFLHWGQIAVDDSGGELVTIVGSCVAVCLWDERRRLGGMNHFLLPEAPHVAAKVPRPWSYGELALPALLDGVLALGAARNRLAASVYGGAALTRVDDDGSGPGARNVALASSWLFRKGIEVVAADVGGRRGRKLCFDTGSGEVRVRLL